MTTYRLFRIRLRTRTGLTVYAQPPEKPGRPPIWTSNEKLAGRWMAGAAIEVHASLLREHKPARLERCDEIISDEVAA